MVGGTDPQEGVPRPSTWEAEQTGKGVDLSYDKQGLDQRLHALSIWVTTEIRGLYIPLNEK